MLRKLALLTAVGYSIILVIVSFINLYDVPKLGSSHDDKIYHIVSYFILVFLWLTYFKPLRNKYTTISVIMATCLFGFVVELLQHQLNPNRTYDTLDILANCVGVLIGTFFAIRINIYKLK